jgi:hypothetical protein
MTEYPCSYFHSRLPENQFVPAVWMYGPVLGGYLNFERTVVSILIEPIKNEPGYHPNKQFPVLTNCTILTDLAILNT